MTEHPGAVLDASAVLAWLQQEPGHEVVDPLLDGGAMSAANLAEVLQKVADKGHDPRMTSKSLKALGVRVEALVEADAAVVAAIWFEASHLSLGDRCCLALARRLGARAVTAEQAWAVFGDDVVIIR